MTFTRRTIPRWILAGAATVAGTIGLAAVPVSSSADQSLGALHSRLGAVQAHEQSLASSISSLSRLISSLDSQITLVETREAAVRADLAADRAKLQKVQASLTRERRLLALLRARLARARMLLSRQLVSDYEQSKPNLVSVVLESNGFNDLLDKLAFLRDAQAQQQTIISITQQAKARADAAATRLAALQATDKEITVETAQRVRALAGMNQLLHSKQAALQQARSVQASALSATREKGAALQAEIGRIEAAQAAAERAALAQQQAAANASSSPFGQFRQFGRPDPGRPVIRPVRRLGDPVRDRAVRVRRPGPEPEQRRRLGLLPDHARDVEAVRRHRPGGVPGQQGRAGRGGEPHLERRGGCLQLGVRRDRRHPLTPARLTA